MTLVFFAWLSRQEYFADLIESAKFNYEEAVKPEALEDAKPPVIEDVKPDKKWMIKYNVGFVIK